MDFSHLKTQVMAMFAIQQGGNRMDIFVVLYSLVLMTVIERAFKFLPAALEHLWTTGTAYVTRKQLTNTFLIPTQEPTAPTNSITLRRSYESKATESDANVEKVDGVLEYICNLDTARHIKLDRRFILNNKEEIPVTSNITAKVTNLSVDENGELSNIELTLTSTKLAINEMRAWIDTIYREYCFEKDNKLGQKKYYFNEIPVEPIQEMPARDEILKEKKYRWETAPKTLSFTMNEFATSKSFTNVFGEHVAELKERLNLFMNYPEWYHSRGIPHSLGVLLHGIPGAGKTSTIKAIARDTKRHIFNLSLRPYTTQKQLTHLFFNENVVVAGDDGVRQIYRIPMNQRVFVIEDIDCLTNVVYQRTGQRTETDGDAITLSFLLNLLDGVLETPGRILIITSNYPEKLDKALVRPGRIDVNIRFEEADRKLILDMYNNFYGLSCELEDIPDLIDRVFTPAEVLECFCGRFKDSMAALADLVHKAEHRSGTAIADLTPAPIPFMEQSLYLSPSKASLALSDTTMKEPELPTESTDIPASSIEEESTELKKPKEPVPKKTEPTANSQQFTPDSLESFYSQKSMYDQYLQMKQEEKKQAQELLAERIKQRIQPDHGAVEKNEGISLTVSYQIQTPSVVLE